MPFDTPENINIVNSDDGIKRTANVEPVDTCPSSGGALSVNITNAVRLADADDCSLRDKIYDTIPASGEIASGDNPLLVVAPIYGRSQEDIIVPAETVEISGINRVAVDAYVTGASLNFQRYRPRVYQDVLGTTLTNNQELLIYEFDGDGQLDMIAIKTEDGNFSIRLQVDGTDIYDVEINDLNASFKFVGGDVSAVQTFSYDANKGFVDVYPNSVDFTDGFKVYVKRTGGNPKKVVAAYIKYREKIV